MYKPNDIVAVYGELSHGGTLIYDRHDAPKDENDPILKRYTLMDVVEVKNQDAMIVRRRGGDTGTMFVHPKQCRLVSRDGVPVEPKKALFILTVEDEDGCNHVQVGVVDSPEKVRAEFKAIIKEWSSDGEEDASDAANARVFKAIEITEEFKL
jgi:hypothetical protein